MREARCSCISLQGHWVFLANCHLSISWLPELDKIVEQLQTAAVHNDFRLWLSSSPTIDFPISILQIGLKITNEPQKVNEIFILVYLNKYFFFFEYLGY